MSHTQLFHALRMAFRHARISARPGAPDPTALVEMAREKQMKRWSRREALKMSGAGVAALGLGSRHAFGQQAAGSAATAPEIVIVGAGIAGLCAAHTLKKHGIIARLYDGAKRSGGRMFTAKDRMAPGLMTELGGEFVDSGHEDILALAQEFGLELIDVQAPSESSLIADAYFFDGQHYKTPAVIEAFTPIAEKIAQDYDALGEVINFEDDGGAKELDQLSIAAYLDKLGCSGWFRKLLDVAYVTEYGLETSEQSCLNLIDMISTDVSGGEFAVFGDSDERYKIRGGNQRVPDAVAKTLEGQIKLDHALESIKQNGTGYTLNFLSSGKSVEVKADVVIMTIPFSILRDIKMDVELPDVKKLAINELGYGRNTKVFAGMKKAVWRDQGFGGNIFSDEAFQLAWDSGRLQGTTATSVSFYSGGEPAKKATEGDHSQQVQRFLPGLEKAFPGVKAAFNGKAGSFNWPAYKWSLGSYSVWKVGQWTTLAGAEFPAVGNLHFAGEHTSYDYQGYMNGGAETGRRAAEAILEQLGLFTPPPPEEEEAPAEEPAAEPALEAVPEPA